MKINMCSTLQILFLLTCFVALSTQKKPEVNGTANNSLTNKPKREAALADGSEYFGLADALKPKVHHRYSPYSGRLHSSRYSAYDGLEGFRASPDDFNDKVETYIIKTEEGDDGRPKAVYKVFASDPNIVAAAFGSNFHREIKNHKGSSKPKYHIRKPIEDNSNGFPNFDVNQVKSRYTPLLHKPKINMPPFVSPYQNTLRSNPINYRQGPQQIENNVKNNQVQQFNAQTQATPVHNCNHNQQQAQGYAYTAPQLDNNQAHAAIAVSSTQALQQQQQTFNAQNTNAHAQPQNFNQQQQTQYSNAQALNQAQTQTQPQNFNQQQALNQAQPQTNVQQNQNNQPNNAVPANHQPNNANTFAQNAENNQQANNNNQQVDKGRYNNQFTNNNNNNNVLSPQALTHVIPGPVHNTPTGGTIKYFNVAVSTNHLPLPVAQPQQQPISQAQPNFVNAPTNNNQAENVRFLQQQSPQNDAGGLSMMSDARPSYGFGGEHGDLSASLDALATFGNMPTGYEYPSASITHLGEPEPDEEDKVPAYAQGHKGLSHYTKFAQLNTDTIDSNKYNSNEQFQPSPFLGSVNDAGPPTSANYEYPDVSVLNQKTYSAPVFESESLYANHRYS